MEYYTGVAKKEALEISELYVKAKEGGAGSTVRVNGAVH